MSSKRGNEFTQLVMFTNFKEGVPQDIIDYVIKPYVMPPVLIHSQEFDYKKYDEKGLSEKEYILQQINQHGFALFAGNDYLFNPRRFPRKTLLDRWTEMQDGIPREYKEYIVSKGQFNPEDFPELRSHLFSIEGLNYSFIFLPEYEDKVLESVEELKKNKVCEGVMKRLITDSEERLKYHQIFKRVCYDIIYLGGRDELSVREKVRIVNN